MKWLTRFGATALMLGISATAPAGLFGEGLFSSHGGHDGCCPQPAEPCCEAPCDVAPTCEAPCEVDCTSDGCFSGRKHRKGGLFGRLGDMFKRDRSLCGHEPGCANEGCCPQDCCPQDCHAGPVGRAHVGGPVGKPVPPQGAAPTAPAPAQQAAPVPMTQEGAEGQAEEAPAPPQVDGEAEAAPAPPEAAPPAAPQAAPAPAPPEDAEAYFPSRFRS